MSEFDPEKAKNLTKNYRKLKVSKSSRRGYINSSSRFLTWIIKHKPDLATTFLLEAVNSSGNGLTERVVKQRVVTFISDPKREKPPSAHEQESPLQTTFQWPGLLPSDFKFSECSV